MEEFKWDSIDVHVLGKKVDTQILKVESTSKKYEYYMHRGNKYYFRTDNNKLSIETKEILPIKYGCKYTIDYKVSNQKSYHVSLLKLDDEISKLILKMPKI